jgi:hypothetical protein
LSSELRLSECINLAASDSVVGAECVRRKEVTRRGAQPKIKDANICAVVGKTAINYFIPEEGEKFET